MLEGKRILLIGGTKGLGQEICAILSLKNHVISAARTSRDHRLDLLAGADEVRSRCAEFVAELGGLDVLIVSSGMGAYHTPLVSEEDIQALFAVNVFGPIHAFQACLPHLMRSKGKAMVVSSTVARRPGAAGLSIYAATKGALNSWVISESRRVAKKGIALFACAPGWFDSPMTGGISPELRARSEAGIPFRRFGTAGEIAEFSVALLGQSNWALAGQIFEMTGGA